MPKKLQPPVQQPDIRLSMYGKTPLSKKSMIYASMQIQRSSEYTMSFEHGGVTFGIYFASIDKNTINKASLLMLEEPKRNVIDILSAIDINWPITAENGFPVLTSVSDLNDYEVRSQIMADTTIYEHGDMLKENPIYCDNLFDSNASVQGFRDKVRDIGAEKWGTLMEAECRLNPDAERTPGMYKEFFRQVGMVISAIKVDYSGSVFIELEDYSECETEEHVRVLSTQNRSEVKAWAKHFSEPF